MSNLRSLTIYYSVFLAFYCDFQKRKKSPNCTINKAEKRYYLLYRLGILLERHLKNSYEDFQGKLHH